MNTLTNNLVAESWSNGKPAKNHRGNFTTDGFFLFSYKMLIGITMSDGRKISLKGGVPYRVTTTTTRHCGHASSWSLETIKPVENPDSWRYIWNTYLFPHELLSQAVNVNDSILSLHSRE